MSSHSDGLLDIPLTSLRFQNTSFRHSSPFLVVPDFKFLLITNSFNPRNRHILPSYTTTLFVTSCFWCSPFYSHQKETTVWFTYRGTSQVWMSLRTSVECPYDVYFCFTLFICKQAICTRVKFTTLYLLSVKWRVSTGTLTIHISQSCRPSTNGRSPSIIIIV